MWFVRNDAYYFVVSKISVLLRIFGNPLVSNAIQVRKAVRSFTMLKEAVMSQSQGDEQGLTERASYVNPGN